jgi:hypothetical protein
VSAQSNKARLAGLLKQLVSSWEETRGSWTDDKAREFHERYMVELIAQVEKTLTALDSLEALIQKMKDDCE